MGLVFGDEECELLLDKICCLLEKVGYQVVFLDNLDNFCCGQLFVFKGYVKQVDDKCDELFVVLFQVSCGGFDLIYCDISFCILCLVQGLDDLWLQIYDLVKFICSYLFDCLEFILQDKLVVVYVICSIQYFGESQVLIDLVGCCICKVVILEGIYCCGFVGDKGFIMLELNVYFLCSLKDVVQFCEEGVFISCICEIGFSEYGGIDYCGVVYLVDWVMQVKGVFWQGE